MNAGAAYESLILQSITNTLGNFYGVDEVYIMVEGKPYESGHILLKKGETLKVNMDLVAD
jgi:spore germination protein GerM